MMHSTMQDFPLGIRHPLLHGRRVHADSALMGHPSVRAAAVVGVPDDRWDERPMACVVLADGARFDPAELRRFLEARVAKWWLPERWIEIDEVPKTSVGKFDNKVPRPGFADGALDIVEVE